VRFCWQAATAARVDVGLHAVCLFFAVVSNSVSVLPGPGIEASKQAASTVFTTTIGYAMDTVGHATNLMGVGSTR